MKQLIHVSCTSAYKYPERPRYLLIRGKKYEVARVLQSVKIQAEKPPFHLIHSFKLELAGGQTVEIEYHEHEMEWYLIDGGEWPIK